MPTKVIAEMVWAISEYNAKIQMAVKFVFKRQPWLTFTEPQISVIVKQGYPWLVTETKKQRETLGTIIRITCRSLIQQGLIVKVKCPMNIGITWQWREGAEDIESSHTILTGNEIVVKSEKGKEIIRKYGPLKGLDLYHVQHEAA